MVMYANQMVESWQDKTSLDIESEMANVTMNIVVKALFDVDLHSDTGDLQAAMLKTFEIMDRRIQRVLPIPGWLPTEENKQLQSANEVLQKRIGGIIEDRRVSGEDHGDLLSMLLLAQDEDDGTGMSNQEVYNEVLTLFAAGHETTAGTLTWAFYLLSQHPEIAEALYEQVNSVLGDRPATLEDLRLLPLTAQIIKEAMRLYPPAWAITRQANEDVEIADYALKKRNIVVVSPWTLHRHPDFWDAPEEFRPSRFDDENEGNIPRYAYFPFGGGPRVCIGNSFAMMEAQLVLATVAQHYRLNLDPNQVVEPERRFTLKAKYGMTMLPEKQERVMIPV
jgi:cytochrome P450